MLTELTKLAFENYNPFLDFYLIFQTLHKKAIAFFVKHVGQV